ncbi:hypothetical protein GCM10023232_22740 [Sphingosinicella ginsenosidimutans]
MLCIACDAANFQAEGAATKPKHFLSHGGDGIEIADWRASLGLGELVAPTETLASHLD